MGYFLDNEDQLAERAGDGEYRYLQAITKARNAAEQAYDQKTVERIAEIYDEITNKIEDLEKERLQKVLYSQIWALEKEIEVYGEAIEKVKAPGCENERKCL